jgi:hypothetical protein
VRGEFEAFSEPPFIKLLLRESQKVLLEIRLLDKDHAQIHQARLFTGKGRFLEITPASWKLGDKTHSGEHVDCGGNAVQLL